MIKFYKKRKKFFSNFEISILFSSVLAQCGGTVLFHSHTIPFISLGKFDYILLDSFISILQPTTKILSNLHRRTVPAQSYEIEYLRLIQFYQRKYHQDDNILSNQQQVLISLRDIDKYVDENNIIIDMLLTQYQQNECQKMKKQLGELNENKSIRKPTKRKASTTMTELHNITKEQ